MSRRAEELILRLRRLGNNRFLPGATEEQIRAFENRTGVTLPAQFKEWLLVTDGGDLILPAGVQFRGVAHKPLIDVDCDDRPDDSYIVIGFLAAGDPIVCEKEGERVSIYNHEAGRIEDDETYPDFFSFMNDLKGILGIGG